MRLKPAVLANSLTGPDLSYWVAMANAKGSHQAPNVLRRHYGESGASHDPASEPSMRAYVASKFGENLPTRDAWQ